MEASPQYRIDVVNETSRRVRLTSVREVISATLKLHHREQAEVDVLLTEDDRIRSLNAEYRGIDESTDVLSFPGGDHPYAPLGDIAISVPYAKRQANARRVSLDTEIRYLAIHGCLHLLGFDDESEKDHRMMVKEMWRVGTSLGMREDPDWSSILHREANGE